jgi:hypothetical protein
VTRQIVEEMDAAVRTDDVTTTVTPWNQPDRIHWALSSGHPHDLARFLRRGIYRDVYQNWHATCLQRGVGYWTFAAGNSATSAQSSESMAGYSPKDPCRKLHSEMST